MTWFQSVELAANGGALLVHLALKATVVLLVTFAVMRILRRSSAALRHALWFVCCLGLLLLPAFTVGLPAWQPSAMSPLVSSAVATNPTDVSAVVLPQETTSALVLRTIAAGYSGSAPAISTEQWIFAAVFTGWLLGAVAATRKWASGLVVAKRLQSRGRSVEEGELWQEFKECAVSLGLGGSRFVAAPRLVLVDDEVLPIPLTWGWRRPVVLVPSAAMQWSVACRRAAFLHELSHIRRLDWLIQSMASLACLFYWFHPLAWFASGRLRLESERATDDHVLATGLKATDYSSSLLEIVRFVGSGRGSGAHQKDSLMKFAVPVAGTSKIEIRLRSILDPKQSRSAVTKKLLAAISLFACAAVVPLAAAKEPAEADQPDQPQRHAASESRIAAPPRLSQEHPMYVREAFADANTGENRTVTKEMMAVEGSDEWREVYVTSSANTPSQTPDDSGRTVYGGLPTQVVRILHPAKKRIVTGFKFTGNTLLKDDELQKALTSKTGVVLEPQNFSADVSAIRSAYSARGFYGWVKNATQDKDGVISYNLVENRTAKPPVKGFKFTGTTVFKDEELKKLLVSKTGVVFNQQNFVSDFIAIRKAYTDKGLDVEMKNATQDEAGVVSYNLIEHRAATGFKFTGNTLLKDEDLKKVLVSKAGMVLGPQEFSADAAAIRKVYADKGLFGGLKNATQDAAGVISYNLVEQRIEKTGAPAPAQPRQLGYVVTGFKFIGNFSFPSDELEKVLASKKGVLLETRNVIADTVAIQRAYHAKGIYVQLKSTTQDRTGVISYDVQEFHAITGFKFIGNTFLTSEELQKVLVSKAGAIPNQASVAADMTAIRNAYSDRGISIATQYPSQDGAGVMTYGVQENRAVTGFQFSGNTVLTSDDLQKVLVSKKGSARDWQNIADDVTAIKKAYSDKGYTVSVRNLSQNDAGAISYDLLEAKLMKIELSGLTKTNTQEVRRLIKTPVNEILDASRLRLDLKRLEGTNLFEQVSYGIHDSPDVDGGVIVTFKFKEK